MGRERLQRWLFGLLALALPALVVQTVVFQARTPMLEVDLFRALSDPGPLQVQAIAGEGAAAAGLRPLDVLLTVDGFPFVTWNQRTIGPTCTVEIARRDQHLSVVVPTVQALRFNLPWVISGAIVALAYWGTGTLLLHRRFRRRDVRILFLLTQAVAIALLIALAHPRAWPVPAAWVVLGRVCFYLMAALFLHYHLTFPVPLGSLRQRRWGIGLLYTLAATVAMAVIASGPLAMKLAAAITVLEAAAAVGVVVYVYLRRATPADRRRLRLVVAGTVLGLTPPILGYAIPSIISEGVSFIPTWLASLFLVIPPFAYLYATARHNLFDIDRLLNRALVYALLSLGIFILCLGPFLLIYRSLPGDWLAQAAVVAALTLLVGLTFDWLRTRVQRLVDRLFYGGWYDYPGVVETVSDGLARSLERAQLTDVLTRQVPTLMQLHAGQLWIGEPDEGLPSRATPPSLQFAFTFDEHVRGVWTVGPRRDGEDFSSADRRILETLARQAETALRNVLLVETLRRQLDEIRASGETLAQAQRQLLRSREEERARLARDLHDGPIQDLVGLSLQLGLLLQSAQPPGESLEAMRGEVRGLLSELRQLCAELRPPMLDTLGLGAALRALADEWSTQHRVAVHLDLPPDAALRPLPGEVAVNLYRVVQEALSNVARHAAARQVAIRLTWNPPRLALSVQDDGRGFDAPLVLHDAAAQGHFGLVGMQERVALIGGAWTLESVPGQGTTVHVTWSAA